jgi:hypothetical protein
MNPVEPTSKGTVLRFGRTVLFGIVLGSLPVSIFLVVSSHHKTFAAIEVGMSREQTLRLIHGDGLFCDNPPADIVRCDFSDSTRHYYLTFNPESATVNQKYFSFKLASLFPYLLR